MGLKAVLNNLNEKGLQETLRIRKERKTKRYIDQINNINEEIKNNYFHTLENEIKSLWILANSKEISNNQYKDIYDEISLMESEKGYKKYLRDKYIKRVFPFYYNLYKDSNVENKVVFMDPRSGINQSFKYIHNKIKNEGKYEIEVHNLHRGDVPYTQYYLNAIPWIKSLATSKACFVHESNNLLGHIDIKKETKVIQLWHGCGVFKKIGLSTANLKSFKSMKTYEEFPEYNKYDAVTIASPELSWVFEEFMDIKKESGIIKAIGVSRTDEFFDSKYLDNCYRKLHKIIPKSKDKKVILYAPTYRGVGKNRITPETLDIKKFADSLSKDYILILKYHQTSKNSPSIPEEYENIFAYDMTRGKGMDINELMSIADIMITDYSSVAFEYSLFERPIIFYAFDLEDYLDERGLYYNYDEITPGPVVKTNEEMIEYIKDIDNKFNKQEVVDFKNKFMSSCDGHSTERILELMEE